MAKGSWLVIVEVGTAVRTHGCVGHIAVNVRAVMGRQSFNSGAEVTPLRAFGGTTARVRDTRTFSKLG